MIKFLYGFLVFLFAYFIIYVTGNYYLLQISPLFSYIFPIIKEGSWFVFIMISMRIYRKQLSHYISQTTKELSLLCLIALWGVATTLLIHGYSLGSLLDIAIGLKYGLYSSVIFFTAAWIGYINIMNEQKMISYIKRITVMIVGSCIIGLIWQGAKRWYPDFFYDVLGYGPIGDYKVGQAHPIYYRTGPGGGPRFSGLMSGPNNLGYLLVAYASIVPFFIKNWYLRCVYYVVTVMTLSRAALLGSVIQGVKDIVYYIRTKNKAIGIILIVIVLVVVVVLSIIKGSSTIEHFSRTLGGMQRVVESPRGLGLGSSGPGVHRHGDMLPENFYLQLLLDYGIIPFVGWCLYRYYIIKRSMAMMTNSVSSKVLYAYLMGFTGLLVVGLFLHVFEDSVVNYVFFIPFGMMRGSQIRQFAKS